MKSYTDLEQSKKLAEILPHKSADGTWEKVSICGAKIEVPEDMQYRHKEIQFSFFSGIGIPSWSLAALVHYLSSCYLISPNPGEKIYYCKCEGQETSANNPVDACYEMILNLYEQKIL